ncbi:hypothetical protein [Xinfangfangia pollutisoli]|uniref:hypothetical protein n=1 Tax=Xinfangfangia pollutisoli TaxID=2865960 RepID=UPI001CD6D14E|nr:hypothetical protein [Xinfangfangia pollutisoli]
MSQRYAQVLVLAGFLAGCGGNPFLPDEPSEEPANPVEQLPGTEKPSASKSITRYEAREDGNGNGYAENITYDAENDTFSVDNLGFDGDNLYRRGMAVASLGPYRVYEASEVVEDPYSHRMIPQFEHRLLAGVSDSGKTSFAIVRTGAYMDYGFGGFVMKREGGVNLPSSGQAGYLGDYAAIQDAKGASGLRYVTGQAQVAIDFADFNDGDAVQGAIYNRQIFDVNGNDITAAVIGQLNDEFNPDRIGGNDISELPVLSFRVGPGAIDANGEIRGMVDSFLVDYGSGGAQVVTYETGNYYAIIAGENAEEIVGIIVVESADPYFDNVTVRETGGFIAYR